LRKNVSEDEPVFEFLFIQRIGRNILNLLAHVPHRYKNDVANIAPTSERDGPKKYFQNDTFFSEN
jgi:hypothetical protein